MLRGQNPDSNYVKEIDSLSLQNKIQCSKAQYQEAIKSITQAEQICLKHLGDFNSKYAYTLFLHGRTQYLFGYLKDADSLYQKALQIQKKIQGSTIRIMPGR
ncbi:MAG: tetratricopeptide repeat protein [Saprospiraceae bacterium]